MLVMNSTLILHSGWVRIDLNPVSGLPSSSWHRAFRMPYSSPAHLSGVWSDGSMGLYALAGHVNQAPGTPREGGWKHSEAPLGLWPKVVTLVRSASWPRHQKEKPDRMADAMVAIWYTYQRVCVCLHWDSKCLCLSVLHRTLLEVPYGYRGVSEAERAFSILCGRWETGTHTGGW